MPGSARYGKKWTGGVLSWLHQETPFQRILDIGTGRGTYSNLFRQKLAPAQWVGVEAWEPYIKEFDLASRYDQLILGDARKLDWPSLGHYDVAFLGDILEHMTQEEALALYTQALSMARFVVVSIPIIHYPQDDVHGNPFEVHVKDNWSHTAVMETFPQIVAFLNENMLGVYIAAAAPNDKALLVKRHEQVHRFSQLRIEADSLKNGHRGNIKLINGPFQGEYPFDQVATVLMDQILTEPLKGTVFALNFYALLVQTLLENSAPVDYLYLFQNHQFEHFEHTDQTMSLKLDLHANIPGMTFPAFYPLVQHCYTLCAQNYPDYAIQVNLSLN